MSDARSNFAPKELSALQRRANRPSTTSVTTLYMKQTQAQRQREATRRNSRLSKEDQALAVLELTAPVTMEEVRTRYRSLVKKLHPDANGGNKAAEERLKVVNQAYSVLKKAALA